MLKRTVAFDVMKINEITSKIKNKGKEKVTENDVLAAIIIATVIVFGFFIYVNFIPRSLKKISVEIIEITGECDDCFDLAPIKQILIKEDIEVNSKTLDYDSEKAKTLIKNYNIKSVPALIIISRDLNKIKMIDEATFSIEKNYAIFDRSVPYIDITSGKIKGLVNLKEIYDSSCIDCMPLSQLQRQLESWGIKVGDYEIVDSSSVFGKKLIAKNSITFLPSLLVSKNIKEYWWVFDQIKKSFIENDDYYVFKTPIPPYKDIFSGEIKGIVDITYLTDESCEDCFNVTQLKAGFQSMGIYINNEKYVDVSSVEGKNLLNRYDITAIPTIILSKEILDYESIREILEKLGTFEKDKVFIFRKLDNLNVKYQKLE